MFIIVACNGDEMIHDFDFRTWIELSEDEQVNILNQYQGDDGSSRVEFTQHDVEMMRVGETLDLYRDGFMVTRIAPNGACQARCECLAEYAVWQDVDYIATEFNRCARHVPSRFLKHSDQ